jgi:hypothetical protein
MKPDEAGSKNHVCKRSLTDLNYLLFFVGMIGVWITTHSLQVMLFAFIASIHVTVQVKHKSRTS